MGEEEKFLMNPIIVRKPGECIDCGFPISVLERQITDICLNNEGLPIRYEIPHLKLIGYCPHCGATYPNIVHVGIHFDIRSLRYL